MVKAWLMDTKLEHEEVNMGRQIVVSVILVRNTFGVIMVTYVPTLLMNIINQVTSHHTNLKLVSIYEATTYIRLVEKYELIVTVNITCMMVLTSVYLSVSTSLPSTSNIKPVEVWLLFNLAYPFLVIITNILLQVGLTSGRS